MPAAAFLPSSSSASPPRIPSFSLGSAFPRGDVPFCLWVSQKRKTVSVFAPIPRAGIQIVARCTNEWLSGSKDFDGTERPLLAGIQLGDQNEKHLSDLCTFGIGGPCRHFLEVRCPAELACAVRYLHERSMPFIVVGKGSNCLFDDRGFNGCVVLNRISTLGRAGPGVYRVGSGYPFNGLGALCSGEGYSGLEFAGGVPGTVGGAAFMNASANGQETGDSIENVDIVTKDGQIRRMHKEDMSFGYRKSTFQEMEDLAAILAVTFRLTPSPSSKERQQEYLRRRRRAQPLNKKSAGSVFCNPADSDLSAGGLIERAGLKGLRIGGAQVSEIHANFFINSGNATSRDMLALINHVKEKVENKFGIQLKEEIRYIPYNAN